MRQLKPQISCFTLLQGALTTATICSNHRRLGAHQFVRIHLTFAARKGSSAGSRRLRAKLLATMTVLYAKALSIFLFPTLAVASVAPFWPLPTQYTVGSTPLALSSDFLFNVDTSSPILVQAAARYQARIFGTSTAKEATKSQDANKATTSELSGCSVHVTTIVDDEAATLVLGVDESYNLKVTVAADDDDAEPGCAITAPTVWGALRAMETFTQTLARTKTGSSISTSSNKKTGGVPASDAATGVEVTCAPFSVVDSPRFPHRGLMVDTSRHYLPLSFLEHLLDACEMNKFNFFHVHLVDAQSFPLVLPSAPELADGAWGGASSPLTYNLPQDIVSLAQYAMNRGVMLVLEIDVPGHAASWGAGRPDVMANCEAKYYYNINNFALNPTLDATYTLLDEVIGDLATSMEGLPPATLHLGGDEVIYGCWANDSSIVDWMAVNGTQYGIAPGDYDALLSYFVSKAQALAANHGFSQPTQWEEVFKAGCDVTPNTVYQVWTGAQYVGACTAANYAVVASPSSYWYLDHADNTASVMYDYDPSVDLSDAQQALLLGGEVNMWGEHVDEHNHDAITWPRAAAVAERLWSSSQAGATMEDDSTILLRLEGHRCRLVNNGIQASALEPGYCATKWV